MTRDEAQKINVGDKVRLRGVVGDVRQTTRRWFMVTWPDRDSPEIVWRRCQTILLTRLERVE